jgi:Kdo2-lipid IVA lauroyltransferase/acyltransferase
MSDEEMAAPQAAELEAPRKPRLSRRLRVNALYGCVRGFEILTRIVPPLGSPAVGAALGRFVYAVAPPLVRQSLRQLDLCYGEGLSAAQKREVVRRMFEHLGRAVFDVLRLRRMGRDEVDRLVEVDGLCHFEEARAAGRGFIIVTGHLGNWELMAAWVAARVPLGVLARLLPNWRLNDWLVETRRRHGVRTIYRGSFSAAREAIRSLRRGEALGILIDQDTLVDGAFVPFFGRPAFTPTGAAALALRTGALLLPTFIHREGPRHRLVFEPPVPVEARGSKHDTQVEYTALMTQRIERRVREHPEQWVWMHRRFKTRPPSEAVS